MNGISTLPDLDNECLLNEWMYEWIEINSRHCKKLDLEIKVCPTRITYFKSLPIFENGNWVCLYTNKINIFNWHGNSCLLSLSSTQEKCGSEDSFASLLGLKSQFYHLLLCDLSTFPDPCWTSVFHICKTSKTWMFSTGFCEGWGVHLYNHLDGYQLHKAVLYVASLGLDVLGVSHHLKVTDLMASVDKLGFLSPSQAPVRQQQSMKM